MKANLVDLSDLVMLNPTTTSSRFSQQHLLVSHDVIFSFVVDFPIPLMNDSMTRFNLEIILNCSFLRVSGVLRVITDHFV